MEQVSSFWYWEGDVAFMGDRVLMVGIVIILFTYRLGSYQYLHGWGHIKGCWDG